MDKFEYFFVKFSQLIFLLFFVFMLPLRGCDIQVDRSYLGTNEGEEYKINYHRRYISEESRNIFGALLTDDTESHTFNMKAQCLNTCSVIRSMNRYRKDSVVIEVKHCAKDKPVSLSGYAHNTVTIACQGSDPVEVDFFN